MSTDPAGLTGVTSMATRHMLDELAQAYRESRGARLSFEALGGVEAVHRLRNGMAVDIVALARPALARLAEEGLVMAGTQVNYAVSGIAVAVRSGATRPDLSNEGAARLALLGADRIAYSTGPSGHHVQELWRRWGASDVLLERGVLAPPGVSVASLVASGEADIGLQQLSELMGVDGIEIAGALPQSIQLATTFAAAATGRRPGMVGLAKDFLNFLCAPGAASAIARNGMSAIRNDSSAS